MNKINYLFYNAIISVYLYCGMKYLIKTIKKSYIQFYWKINIKILFFNILSSILILSNKILRYLKETQAKSKLSELSVLTNLNSDIILYIKNTDPYH